MDSLRCWDKRGRLGMDCPPQVVTELYQRSGMDGNAVGSCAERFFAPIDASFADDTPLLPSGFHIIPLDYGKEASGPHCTLGWFFYDFVVFNFFVSFCAFRIVISLINFFVLTFDRC
ncbi:hypothetical protein TB2_035096 [Malus domestica]